LAPLDKAVERDPARAGKRVPIFLLRPVGDAALGHPYHSDFAIDGW
jgi:hypothetical protein